MGLIKCPELAFVFNHDDVILVPAALTGFLTNGSNANNLNATFWGQLRACTWTNTISF